MLRFTTGLEYKGNLGGLEGANAKCNDSAAGAGDAARVAGRKYKAWLSLTATFASTVHVHGALPYVRPDGLMIADSWEKFASASHRVAMDIDESGKTLPGGVDVWTATEAMGPSLNGTCDGWTFAGTASGDVSAMNATSAHGARRRRSPAPGARASTASRSSERERLTRAPRSRQPKRKLVRRSEK